MLFPGTKQNRTLADATISRLKAEARMQSTRASLFRIGGYSAFVVCLGLGFGAAMLGYASIKKAHGSSHEIANILVKAISNASITTRGEVKLLPRRNRFHQTKRNCRPRSHCLREVGIQSGHPGAEHAPCFNSFANSTQIETRRRRPQSITAAPVTSGIFCK